MKIDNTKLISIFRRFKENPKTIYVQTDFQNQSLVYGKNIPVYLSVLALLGIIERVPVKYYYGRKYSISKNVKGYKLKVQS